VVRKFDAQPQEMGTKKSVKGYWGAQAIIPVGMFVADTSILFAAEFQIEGGITDSSLILHERVSRM
jgi:hypothetical protein